MIVGLIIRISPGTLIQKSVSFNYQFFFNLLLPPIILASGYELHQVSSPVGPSCSASVADTDNWQGQFF